GAPECRPLAVRGRLHLPRLFARPPTAIGLARVGSILDRRSRASHARTHWIELPSAFRRPATHRRSACRSWPQASRLRLPAWQMLIAILFQVLSGYVETGGLSWANGRF